jgi:hypothetical protein
MNKDGDYLIFNCPHCDQMIEVRHVNCAIFRCGIIKQTGHQIQPHESKTLCDHLKNKDMIYGCGKPFQLIPNGESYDVHKCDYI